MNEKLPEIETPEHYQLMWDSYYKLAEGMRAGIKLTELRFVEDLNEQQIDRQLDTIKGFKEQLKFCEDELSKIQLLPSVIMRIPPPYEKTQFPEKQKGKLKSWLARFLGY